MKRFTAICVAAFLHTVPLVAAAQIVIPETYHYQDAYDAIAKERARRDLLLLERHADELARMAALAQEVRIAASAHHRAVIRAWSVWVQRQHGMRVRNHAPGTGWHEVNRGD